MHELKADLHIHSCLSTCGSLDNSPEAIVAQAKKLGLDVVAIADHNCAFNLKAFHELAVKNDLIPLCGIEVTTTEEAHVLVLFDNLETALEFGKEVYDSLPDVKNNPDLIGDQVICDIDENIEFADKYLLNASGFSFNKLFKKVMQLGGAFIPAHIDRQAFSIVVQLGFLPRLEYSCLELTKQESAAQYSGFSHIANSDAHYIEDIGKRYSTIYAEKRLPQSALQAIKLGKITPQFNPLI